VSPLERVARAAIAATTSDIAASRGVITRPGDTPFVGVERALVNEFDRTGFPVKVDENAGFEFGHSRTARPEDVDQIWFVVENGASLSVLAAAPGARVLWNSSPLTASEERELEGAQRDLWTVLERTGRTDIFFQLQSPLVALVVAGVPGVDRARVDRVAELNARVDNRAFAGAPSSLSTARMPPRPRRSSRPNLEHPACEDAWSHAGVAELANALGLGPSVERRGSTSLPARTRALTGRAACYGFSANDAPSSDVKHCESENASLACTATRPLGSTSSTPGCALQRSTMM
jgi:hypothetical protein